MVASGSSSPQREWMTYLILASVLLVGSAVLLIVPLGFFGPVMVMGGWLFAGGLAFHYFVWGKWLAEIVEQEEQRDDSAG